MPDRIKPGHKTSEFLSAGGLAAFIAFHQEAGVTLTQVQIQALTLIAVAYVVGRSVVKAVEIYTGAMARPAAASEGKPDA